MMQVIFLVKASYMMTRLIVNTVSDIWILVSELRAVCKKCIHDKLTDDDEESETETETFNCPVCNADLGSAPLGKLR